VGCDQSSLISAQRGLRIAMGLLGATYPNDSGERADKID
jgi:hypothetical protein